jgi:NAD(P)-dependent dehydrogenase (short-subunit alcohol dehydrogenase family)
MIDTPYWDAMPPEHREAMFAQTARGLAVRRVGRPEDVAEAVVFLVTNGFTTGTVIECEGGIGLA